MLLQRTRNVLRQNTFFYKRLILFCSGALAENEGRRKLLNMVLELRIERKFP